MPLNAPPINSQGFSNLANVLNQLLGTGNGVTGTSTNPWIIMSIVLIIFIIIIIWSWERDKNGYNTNGGGFQSGLLKGIMGR